VVDSTRVSHHGHTGITRHSPRNGFNSLFRALPGHRLSNAHIFVAEAVGN
jgi:hypothetical protein